MGEDGLLAGYSISLPAHSALVLWAQVALLLALARLLAPRSSPVAAALVIGGALAVSSLPVIARIVTELGVGRRDVGQLAISVATFQ